MKQKRGAKRRKEHRRCSFCEWQKGLKTARKRGLCAAERFSEINLRNRKNPYPEVGFFLRANKNRNSKGDGENAGASQRGKER